MALTIDYLRVTGDSTAALAPVVLKDADDAIKHRLGLPRMHPTNGGSSIADVVT